MPKGCWSASISDLTRERPMVKVVTGEMPFEDADQIIHAIHHGDVDAFVVMNGTDPQILTLAGADEPYRVLVERMNEGVLTAGPDGRVLFVNDRMSELTGFRTEHFMGRHIATLFAGRA